MYKRQVYYKELPIVTGVMDETLIVTYSPKYKNYQRKVRTRQIEHAEKMIESGKKRHSKNPNDPARFIRKTSVTGDGEIAEKTIYELDPKRIREEEMYDGFYAEMCIRDSHHFPRNGQPIPSALEYSVPDSFQYSRRLFPTRFFLNDL